MLFFLSFFRFLDSILNTIYSILWLSPKNLRQSEDELTKEADSRIVYIEVDGTGIHLQNEKKKRAELKN